jgi:protein-L-isoaspartate O-methyltransferase
MSATSRSAGAPHADDPQPPATVTRSPPKRDLAEVRRLLAEGHPFHLATRLAGPAIDEAPDALRAHLDLPIPTQQALLAEALVDRGIAEPVARAVASVARHELVSAEHQRRAYLDEFHRVHGWSGLTPPSLVAQMLERLELEAGRRQRVLELGVGSGFHALALLRLVPDAVVVGVEVERDLIERARAQVGRLGLAAALTLVHGDGAAAAREHAPFDRVYATFAVRTPAAQTLPLLVDGGIALVPRCVTPHELARDPALGHLREKHPTYESFLAEWQSNLCLTTYRRRGDHLQVLGKLYGISFVGERSGDL